MTISDWQHLAHHPIVRRSRSSQPGCNEITDIIAIDGLAGFDGFDALAELDDDADFGEFDAALLDAPELDDLHEMDDVRTAPLALRADAADLPSAPTRGQHRKPTNNVVKSRILVAAMAAGAATAGAHAAITHSQAPTTVQATGTASQADAPQGIQMVAIRPAAHAVVHDKELANGVAFAQERAEREARLQRPLFAQPTKGVFTSGFGYRWGALHGGIDVANAIGTPILAVTDGVVIDAGPAAGYGMLVKLRHADGTVTLYGHVNTTTVSVGQRVMAGDQIATLGNRGDSTGPHLHFEVLLGGSSRTDPVPWLAKRGINMGG